MSMPSGDGVTPSVPAHTEALREEIANTRADLGETVQALAARADVKARVRAGTRDVAVRADEFRHDLPVLARQWSVRLGRRVRERPVPFAAALGTVVAVLALLRWRRNR
jgi:hypothetical protein